MIFDIFYIKNIKKYSIDFASLYRYLIQEYEKRFCRGLLQAGFLDIFIHSIHSNIDGFSDKKR